MSSHSHIHSHSNALPFRSLPERPSLEQLRKQAKELHRAHRSGDLAGCGVLRRIHRLAALDDAELARVSLTLADAQFALALEHGLPSWVELKHKVELLRGERTVGSVRRDAARVSIEGLPAIGFETSGRCSYAGALSAALSVTEQAFSYDQIMAYSGLAFRTRWFRGTVPGAAGAPPLPDWCPTSAIGELPPEMDAVSAVTGWLQRHDVRQGGRDPGELLPAIIASIDRGVPVLGYPSPEHLDLGILFGYERDGEQVRLCWLDYQREGELVLPAQGLGWLLILLERQGHVPDARRALISALRSDNWRCRQRAVPGRDGAYAYGALAYDTWSRDLEQAADLAEPLRRKLCFVSWFCFAALVDARSAAATFLNQAADDFEDEIAGALRQAAACYAAGCGAMLPAVRERSAFRPPFGEPGLTGWDDAVRSRERAILKQVRDHDAAAERILDQLLNTLS
jgi:hypothetical protein